MLRVKISRKKRNRSTEDSGEIDVDQKAILNREIRVGLIEKATFEQRLEG